MADTLGELLLRAGEHPDAAACGLRFVDRRERHRFASWRRIGEDAAAVCAGLRALGVVPGERVALVFPTGEGFFHAFFGASLAGAVPVPLYPPVRLGRLDEYHRRTARMIEAAGCRLVLADGRIRRLLGRTMAAARPALGCLTLDALPEGGDRAPAKVPADSLALVQFSSGTTVDPKPVALSHRAILAQVRALNDNWRDLEGRRPTGVSWLPLYHDMGLIGCIFPTLDLPSVLTLIPPEVFVTRPAIWLRAISRYRADISVAPNFAYGLCVDKVRDEELEGVDLGTWRLALNGAEAVAPAVLRAFQSRFARWGLRPEALTPVYGLSEAALAVTFSDFDRPFRSVRFSRRALAEGRAVSLATDRDHPTQSGNTLELPSLGRPLLGFELRIVDEHGATLPARQVGRLLIRGPSLMDGYLGRPDATARVWRDGWLDTGDLGFLVDGELFLTGRAKDVLILRGRNHAPSDVEHALDRVAGVRPGCAVAVSHRPDGAATDRLLLFVEHARDADVETRAALPARAVEAVLARTGLRPDEVHVLAPGTLPRTSSGKLRRAEALGRFLAGTLQPPAPVNPLRLGGALAGSAWAYATSALRRRPATES